MTEAAGLKQVTIMLSDRGKTDVMPGVPRHVEKVPGPDDRLPAWRTLKERKGRRVGVVHIHLKDKSPSRTES